MRRDDKLVEWWIIPVMLLVAFLVFVALNVVA
jgi:hypothetical protein